MKRRVFAMVGMAAAISMAVCGCGNSGSGTSGSNSGATSSASSTGSASAGSEGKIKVGVVTMDSGADAYQSAYYDNMKTYAQELGIDLQILDPAGDAAKQSNMVQDLINLDCDVIAVWPVNSETGVASVKAVNQAGILCIAANTNVAESGEQYVECFVGPSNTLEGKQAGEAMMDQIGESAKILEISGPAGYTASMERMGGMHDVIEGTDIEILDSQTGEANREKSQQIMENYLVKYPQGSVDAVFCYDDTTAYGALNALEAAGRTDIKVFAAASGNYETREYVLDGRICATSMQSPILESQAVLNMAVSLAKGDKPEEFYNYAETPCITVDNVESVEIVEW